jgi:hypothetical protein
MIDIASGEIEDEKAAADNASDGGKSAERLWKIGEFVNVLEEWEAAK